MGFATQTSIDPPRFLACISIKNRTYRVPSGREALAVQLVPEGAEELAELFGGRDRRRGGQVRALRLAPGPDGLPLLEDCPSWFAGRIVERHALGDHSGFLLEPFAGAERRHGRDGCRSHSAKEMDPGTRRDFAARERLAPRVPR